MENFYAMAEEYKLLYTGRFSYFCTNCDDLSKIADQGIKIHISANGYEDYLELCKILIPSMVKYGAIFKAICPEDFEGMTYSKTQKGKYITIYPSKWNAEGFFKENASILEREHDAVSCDEHFFGCVYGRYGSMKNRYVIAPDGTKVEDDRNAPYPSFIKGISLNSFIESCS